MIIIDNYDSFTYNIVQYIKMLGIEPKVFKNNEVTVSHLKKLNFSSIILSPGPGSPKNAGITMEVISEFYKSKSILGVCLGHQCIAHFFGADIIKAKTPTHGKCSNVYFNSDEKLFTGFSQGFEAMRYHSLIVDKNTISKPIKVIANIDDEIIAAIKVENYNIYGVQFHPESILTTNGINIFSNFIKISKGMPESAQNK